MSAPGRPEQARESIVMTEREVCTGVVLSDHPVLTLADLCRACGVHADWLMELVEEGLLEPRGSDPARWRFTGVSLRRVRIVPTCSGISASICRVRHWPCSCWRSGMPCGHGWEAEVPRAGPEQLQKDFD